MTTKQDIADASIDADMKPLLEGIVARLDAVEQSSGGTSTAAVQFVIALLEADQATSDKDALYSALTDALRQIA